MKTLLIITLAAASMVSIQGQERAISSAEFDAVEHAADAQFKEKKTPARWTIVTESRIDGRPQTDYTGRTVIEFGPNGSRRSSTVSSFGGVPLKKEFFIKVNGRSYSRTGDGVWKEESTGPNVEPIKGSESDADPANAIAEYKYLGTDVLGGKKVQMYLRTESRRQTSKTGAAERISDSSAKYWFSESGDIYKYEYRSTTRSADQVFHTNIIITKERDPSISISEPDQIAP